MAGVPVGTIFAEIDLDTSRYVRSQQQLLQSATSTSLNIEQNFKNLGIKSSAEMDLMRAKITNSFDMIANSSKATAQDIIRAEEAKNAKLKALNEEQFGKHSSLLDGLKGHYLAVTAAIAVSIGVISKAWDLAKMGADYEEQRGILDNLSTKYKTSADQIVLAMEKASDGLIAKADLMKVALGGLAKGLQPEQLINLADAARILGDTVGKDATTALNELSQALETGKTKSLKGYLGTTIDLEAAFGDLYQKMTETEKAQALYNITMMEATKLQAQQVKEVDDTGDKIERMEASYKNATLAVAGWAKATVAGIYDVTVAVANFITKSRSMAAMTDAQAAAAAVGTKSAIEYADAMYDEGSAASALAKPFQDTNDLIKKQIQARKDAEQAIKDHAAEAKKAAEAAAKAQDEESKAYAIFWEAKDAARTKDAEADQKAREDAVERAKKNAEALILSFAIFFEQQEKDIKEGNDAWQKGEDKKLDATKKLAEQLPSMYRDIYKDLRGEEKSYYDASAKLIEEQAKKYKEAGVDHVVIAKWVTSELEKEDIKRLKASENFMDGVKAGYLEMKNNTYTFATAGTDIFKGFTTASKTAFTDIFKQAFDKGTVDMGTVWEGFTNSMKTTFANVMGNLVQKAMEKVITMLFEADWTKASENVLGIINGAITLWNSFTSDSYAQGGPVRGRANVQGDSYANDTVMARVSPGEYIVPRSAVNSQTLPALEYMRTNKRLPMYADGGVVDPWEWGTGQPWRDDRQYFLRRYASESGTDMSTLELSEYLARRDGKHFKYDGSEEINDLLLRWGEVTLAAHYGHLIDDSDDWRYSDWQKGIRDADVVGSLRMPKGGNRTFYMDGIYEDRPDSPSNSGLLSILGGITKAAAIAIMTYIGNAAGGALGAAAMAGGSTFIATGGDWKSALIASVLAYATSAINSYFSDAGSSSGYDAVVNDDDFYTMANSQQYTDALYLDTGGSTGSWWDNVLDASKKYLAKTVAKAAVKIATSGIGANGDSYGTASFHYDSQNDNGLFAMLQPLLDSIAPQQRNLSLSFIGGGGYSALGGLDYVPRNNFKINAHEGEAVLTKREADQWRGGGGNRPIQITVQVGSHEFDAYIKSLSDGVIVARNQRGVNSKQRVYA